MSLFRPAIALPLFASLGLHAAIGWSILHNRTLSAARDSEPIQIIYSQSLQAPKVVPTAPAPKKKLRGIPVPHEPVKTAEPAKAAEPSEFEKTMETKLKQQEKLLAKLSADTATQTAAPARPKPRSSAEILADPKKGKIFVGYFTDVKRKIQTTFSERFAHRYSFRGGVELGFVVSSQGFIEKVAVLPKGTDGNERLQELAIQCLRESAPFGAFPPELQSDPSITFSVVLYFEDH